jgi:hypothetical protein
MFYLVGMLMMGAAAILLLGLASRRSRHDIDAERDALRERLSGARDTR